ncbi:MAG: hypothetical protein AYK18_03580 [Theionarchaea archaeon DG-70]|nr:MAG: hypothetical protein AYK18_03580 [Theionarchaea archaeon DG-70]
MNSENERKNKNEIWSKTKNKEREKEKEKEEKKKNPKSGIKSKAHTGEHILFRALSTVFEGMSVKKVELDKRNYFLIHYEKDMDWDDILKAERLANRIISEERPVKQITGSKKDVAEQFPQLRVRWDRIKDETVTVVEVEDFDWAACVGEHVSNTREIEYIMVTRVTSVGKGYYEVEFEVAERAKNLALERAHLARKAASVLRTSFDELIQTVKNLKETQEHLTESVRALTQTVMSKVAPEDIEGVSVYIEDVSGADRRTLRKAASKLAGEKDSLVVFVEQVEDAFLVAARGPSLVIDCTALVKVILPEGKGGGKPEYALASSSTKVDLKEAKERIRQFLRKPKQITES